MSEFKRLLLLPPLLLVLVSCQGGKPPTQPPVIAPVQAEVPKAEAVDLGKSHRAADAVEEGVRQLKGQVESTRRENSLLTARLRQAQERGAATAEDFEEMREMSVLLDSRYADALLVIDDLGEEIDVLQSELIGATAAAAGVAQELAQKDAVIAKQKEDLIAVATNSRDIAVERAEENLKAQEDLAVEKTKKEMWRKVALAAGSLAAVASLAAGLLAYLLLKP